MQRVPRVEGLPQKLARVGSCGGARSSTPLVDRARHVVKRHLRVGYLKLARERMIVRCEERAAAGVVYQVREHRVRDGHAVKGRRAIDFFRATGPA